MAVRYFSSHCWYLGGNLGATCACLAGRQDGRVVGGFEADGSHEDGGRDAWKRLVRANSFESRGRGPLIRPLPCCWSSAFRRGGGAILSVLPAFLIWAVLIPENLGSRIETTLTCWRDKWETLDYRGTGPDCH